MDQMQNDSEIQKKNLDVIDFVKEVGKKKRVVKRLFFIGVTRFELAANRKRGG